MDYDSNAPLRDTENINEGLGILYERHVLDRFLERLRKKYNLVEIAETPLLGINGIPGLTSLVLARKGCRVTLLDDQPERLESVRRIWRHLDGAPSTRFVCADPIRRLPFEDRRFDLVWNFMGLGHVRNPANLIREMARISSNLVLLVLPNRWQPWYWLHKLLLDPGVFHGVNERGALVREVKKTILSLDDMVLTEEGVLDVPPWPDTAVSARELLRRLRIPSRFQELFGEERWHWNSLDYYRGGTGELSDTISRLTIIEDLYLPWRFKLLWAHHRFVLAQRRAEA